MRPARIRRISLGEALRASQRAALLRRARERAAEAAEDGLWTVGQDFVTSAVVGSEARNRRGGRR